MRDEREIKCSVNISKKQGFFSRLNNWKLKATNVME